MEDGSVRLVLPGDHVGDAQAPEQGLVGVARPLGQHRHHVRPKTAVIDVILCQPKRPAGSSATKYIGACGSATKSPSGTASADPFRPGLRYYVKLSSVETRPFR